MRSTWCERSGPRTATLGWAAGGPKADAPGAGWGPRSLTLAALLLSACGGDAGEPDPPGDPASPASWELEEELRIGSVDDPEEALTAIGDVLVRPDGGIVVAQPRDQQLRLYAADGTFEGTLGGAGEAPGEFQRVAAVGWVGGEPGDTIWVSDNGLRRVSFFTPEGGFVGSEAVPQVHWMDRDDAPDERAWQASAVRGIHALLPDGRALSTPSFPSFLVAEGIVTRRPVLHLDEAWENPEPAAFVSRENTQIAVVRDQGRHFTGQPWSDAPLMDVRTDGGRIAVVHRRSETEAEAREVRVDLMGPEGDTVAAPTYAVDPRPLDPAEVEETVGERMDRMAERGAPFDMSVSEYEREYRDQLYVPDFRAPVRSVRWVGEELWLRMRTTDVPEEGSLWWVLDEEGELTGEVTLPPGVTPRTRHGPHLWASETGELDVPYLVRYEVSTS